MASRLKDLWRVDEGGGPENPTSHTLVPQVGVVLAVNENKGEITLSRGGGNSLRLTAHPHLLKDVRIWGVVHVLRQGRIIRGLRCL
jgi:hypothetical protein